jgi:hypothetical protein
MKLIECSIILSGACSKRWAHLKRDKANLNILEKVGFMLCYNQFWVWKQGANKQETHDSCLFFSCQLSLAFYLCRDVNKDNYCSACWIHSRSSHSHLFIRSCHIFNDIP